MIGELIGIVLYLAIGGKVASIFDMEDEAWLPTVLLWPGVLVVISLYWLFFG